MLRLLVVLVLGTSVFVPVESRAQRETAKGKKVALLVGVKEYNHKSLPNLTYTENDAEALAAVLKSKAAGFDEVVVLTSARGKKDAKFEPTAENIRKQLTRLLKVVTKDDFVLIGLSGHGLQLAFTDPKTKKEREESFFCASDAKPKKDVSLDELKKTMIPLGELFSELEESGAGVKLMLVDACRDNPKLARSQARNMDVDTLPRPPRGTAALFSCKGGEKAFESDKLKHGVFFHHVIEGLKGEAKNKKGVVTWSTLVDHVVDNVGVDVPKLIGDGARQTPQEIKNIVGGSPVLLSPDRLVGGKDPKPTDGKSKQPAIQDDGPASVFKTAQKAATDGDYAAYLKCLTTDAQEELVLSCLLSGWGPLSMSDKKHATSFEKLLSAHGLDLDSQKKARLQIGPSMLGKLEDQLKARQQLLGFARRIKDRPGFLKAFLALKILSLRWDLHPTEFALNDVNIIGKEAEAVGVGRIDGKEERKEVTFEKNNQKWLMNSNLLTARVPR